MAPRFKLRSRAGRRSQFKQPNRPLGTSGLIKCPSEVVAIILGYLTGFGTLFSAIQTCKTVYESYEAHRHQILPAILCRVCAKITGHDVHWILCGLKSVICLRPMNRDIVQAALLEQVWSLFRPEQLAEMP